MKKLLAILLFVTTGCYYDGTGTGNPLNPDQALSDEQAQTFYLLKRVCERVVSCHAETTIDNCLSGISGLTGFAAKLGLERDPVPDAQAIVNLEAAGTIVPRAAELENCHSMLELLTCNDDPLRDAFNPQGGRNAFFKTPDVLDPVCTGIFAP